MRYDFRGWGRSSRVPARLAIGCGIVLAVAAIVPGRAMAGEALRPKERVGDTSRVAIELTAEGTFQMPPEPDSRQEPKSLALKVEGRLVFFDRVLTLDTDQAARRSVRWVTEAGAAINGEVRPRASVLRAELARLVAELRNGQVVVASTGGPLTRNELEVVQTVGDPIGLAALLPAVDVTVGGSWTVGADASRALSGYDALADNGLEATLKSVDEARAVVALKGTIKGSSLGGDGSIDCDGEFTFDRKAGRVSKLTLRRSEKRKPGPIEAGLEIRSTIKVGREPADLPAELTDSAISSLELDRPSPERELMLYQSPGGKYRFHHDRDWHVYWDDARLTVLKRLDRGQVIAQCNLTAGPNAGKNRHQDPRQFRDDVKKALGTRFRAILGEGEVDGVAAGHYRYKVAAQGQVALQGQGGEVGVLWYYYLLAGPDGDQVIGTFTLAVPQQARFGDQDLQLIGSLEWVDPPAIRP